jgi:hypothetical protein
MTRPNAIRWIVGILAVLATAASAAPWHRGLATSGSWIILVVASLLSVAVPISVNLFEPDTPWMSPAASAVLWLIVELSVVDRSPLGIGFGIFRGPVVLVSEPLPILEPRWVLVAPVLLCWITGSAASEALLRKRTVPLAGLVWIVGFVLAFAATAGASGSEMVAAAILLVTGGASVMSARWMYERATTVSGDPDDSGLNLRISVSGLLALIIATVGLATVLPQMDHFSSTPAAFKRNYPVTDAATLSPPDQAEALRALPSASDPHLFTIQVDHQVAGYVPMAVLDDYSGSSWTLDQAFTPTGGNLGDPPTDLTATTTVVQQYQVATMRGLPWMPFLPTALAVSNLAVRVSPSTDMVLPSASLHDASYDVTSDVVAKTLDTMTDRQIAASEVGVTENPSDVTDPPSERVEVGELDTGLTSNIGTTGSTSSVATLAALASYFRSSNFKQLSVVPAANEKQPDTSDAYGDVANAVATNHLATTEQYATMFVLLARSQGVPARLAVGFRIQNGGPLTPGTSYAVDAHDAWTWAEVYLAGVGWVDVDPTPGTFGTQPLPPNGTTSSTSTTTTTTSPGSAVQHSYGKPIHHHRPRTVAGFPWLVLVVVGILLLIGLIALIPTTLRRRRIRRRRSLVDPRHRTVAAWHESLDEFDEMTGRSTYWMSGAEVVAATRETFGPGADAAMESVRSLGETALFSSSTAIDQAAADKAWAAQSFLRSEALRSLDWRDRLRAELRVLRRHRH